MKRLAAMLRAVIMAARKTWNAYLNREAAKQTTASRDGMNEASCGEFMMHHLIGSDIPIHRSRRPAGSHSKGS